MHLSKRERDGRRWSVAEKLRMVRETLEPSAVAAEVARRNNVPTSRIYDWRQRYFDGQYSAPAPEFVEVIQDPDDAVAASARRRSIKEPSADPTFSPPASAALFSDSASPSALEVEFSDGARVSVPIGYEIEAALRLIAAMRTAT